MATAPQRHSPGPGLRLPGPGPSRGPRGGPRGERGCGRLRGDGGGADLEPRQRGGGKGGVCRAGQVGLGSPGSPGSGKGWGKLGGCEG